MTASWKRLLQYVIRDRVESERGIEDDLRVYRKNDNERESALKKGDGR